MRTNRLEYNNTNSCPRKCSKITLKPIKTPHPDSGIMNIRNIFQSTLHVPKLKNYLHPHIIINLTLINRRAIIINISYKIIQDINDILSMKYFKD